MRNTAIAIAVAVSAIRAASPLASAPLSVRDNFRIGQGGTIFCSAQSLATDKGFATMFDAGYSVTCRDAALPIGKLYKLRDASGAAARLSAARAEQVNCDAASHAETIDGLGEVEAIDCKLKDADVGYRVYQLKRGKLFYSAEGLTGYDSALRLGLRSVVADAPVKGEVSIATTGIGDPSAFARRTRLPPPQCRRCALSRRRRHGHAALGNDARDA